MRAEQTPWVWTPGASVRNQRTGVTVLYLIDGYHTTTYYYPNYSQQLQLLDNYLATSMSCCPGYFFNIICMPRCSDSGAF